MFAQQRKEDVLEQWVQVSAMLAAKSPTVSYLRPWSSKTCPSRTPPPVKETDLEYDAARARKLGDQTPRPRGRHLSNDAAIERADSVFLL